MRSSNNHNERQRKMDSTKKGTTVVVCMAYTSYQGGVDRSDPDPDGVMRSYIRCVVPPGVDVDAYASQYGMEEAQASGWNDPWVDGIEDDDVTEVLADNGA